MGFPFHPAAQAFKHALRSGARISVAAGQESGAPERLTVVLTPQGFVQLLFGFRPAHWIAHQPEVSIPAAILPTLDALFPTGHAWIAGSDAF